MEQIGRNGFSECSAFELWMIVLIQPVLLFAVLGMLQMFLMLKLHPLLSFSICASLLIISTYQRSYFLLGNLGMPLRMAKISEEGLSWKMSGGILFVLLFLCFFLGNFVIRKKDIYG